MVTMVTPIMTCRISSQMKSNETGSRCQFLFVCFAEKTTTTNEWRCEMCSSQLSLMKCKLKTVRTKSLELPTDGCTSGLLTLWFWTSPGGGGGGWRRSTGRMTGKVLDLRELWLTRPGHRSEHVSVILEGLNRSGSWFDTGRRAVPAGLAVWLSDVDSGLGVVGPVSAAVLTLIQEVCSEGNKRSPLRLILANGWRRPAVSVVLGGLWPRISQLDP